MLLSEINVPIEGDGPFVLLQCGKARRFQYLLTARGYRRDVCGPDCKGPMLHKIHEIYPDRQPTTFKPSRSFRRMVEKD